MPARRHLYRGGSVGVPHHDQPERGLLRQATLRPRALPRGRRIYRGAGQPVLPQASGQAVHQGEPELRMERAVDRARGAGGHEAVEEPGSPPRGGDPVAVERERETAADAELEPVAMPPDAEVVLPELEAPPVVVPADHEDRDPAVQRRERGGDPERVARQRRRVGEPELEQVAVDQQRVAQRGDGVQELEQRGFHRGRGVAEVGVGDDDEGVSQHGRKHAEVEMSGQPEDGPVSETLLRVNYSETDQMGVVYHARYLVWLDIARCEHLRLTGMSYQELEAAGFRLVVGEVAIRYRQPARYDDLIRVRCWVRDVATRRIVFGYAVEHADTGRLLATATVSLHPLDAAMALCRLPDDVARRLVVARDPVRL